MPSTHPTTNREALRYLTHALSHLSPAADIGDNAYILIDSCRQIIRAEMDILAARMPQPVKIETLRPTHRTPSGKNVYWLDTQPVITRPVTKDDFGQVYADGQTLKYSNRELPALGDEVEITMNRIGRAHVAGYFYEEGFLGIIARPVNPPAWWIKQHAENKKSPVQNYACVFGAEFKTIEQPAAVPAAELTQHERDEITIAAAIAEFPETFGLRGFAGSRFKIVARDCYMIGNAVMLYLGIINAGRVDSFAKASPLELRQEITA